MPTQSVRNVALVAHVDHGKTTLVDSMLSAAGVFAAHQERVERVMDSTDQERERGITILAKAASIQWRETKINLVDTPGHADFGGEVERALAMVDGILLLVDAADGPMPQTRYVLSKALERHLPAVVVINKVDRADARPRRGGRRGLSSSSSTSTPRTITSTSRSSPRSPEWAAPSPESASPTKGRIWLPCSMRSWKPSRRRRAIRRRLSRPWSRISTHRIIWVDSPSAGYSKGPCGKAAPVALCHGNEEEPPIKRRLTHLMGFSGLGRAEIEEVKAGDLFVVAGFPEVEIGDTFADPANPEPLPRLIVDEPVLKMTFGVNTSPLSGQDGKFLTSRQIQDRLRREILGNVSIRLGATSSPEVVEVAGRGELQLAVLIESMRREGFELQVSRPEVVIRMIEEKPHEPVERAVVDVPDEYVGAVTQAAAPRKGTIVELSPGDPGRSIVTIVAPARGLLGFRSLLMTTTRGTALVHQHHDGWMPWVGELPHRIGGAMISDRSGTSTAFALDNLQKRGDLFIGAGEVVYEGMIIGEASRPDEMVVNAARPKQLTNIRTHASDEAINLRPPRELTLETAIEWIADDELVEVTPTAIRVRKRYLIEADRRRYGKKS